MEDTNRTQPDVIEMKEASTAVIHGVVAMADMPGFFDRSFSELATVLDEQGLVPAGPAFARYAGPPGETADVEVGFRVQGTVSPKGRVRPGSLPAGRVARVVHVGSYDGLGTTWGSLGAWIAGEGLTAGEDLWEVYVTEPHPEMDPADLRTELYWSLE